MKIGAGLFFSSELRFPQQEHYIIPKAGQNVVSRSY